MATSEREAVWQRVIQLPTRTLFKRYIKVANRKTGEVYMEGRLYREIIPEVREWGLTESAKS